MLVHLRSAHLLRAAVTLDLADTLGEEPAAVAELAARTGTDPGVLSRLLAALASTGVFAVTSDGRYIHTPLSRTLCSTHPVGRMIAQDLKSDASWQAWSSLGAAARAGRSPFVLVHGTDFYSYVREHDPEQATAFHQAMSSATAEDNGGMVAALGLPATGVVVDVGGGRGGLLRDILLAAPALRGVLFDTEAVIADALPELVTGELATRCETVAGDALVSIPGEADLYVLRFILHNWDDESCVRILESCARAARPGSRVVVAEMLLEETGTPDPLTAMADMGMFVLFGSRERTEAEYARLFERAGLTYTGTTATKSLHLFEAVSR
ncbi:methyltransferase [Nonomuraea lactucae]|uniref:methyltransferase n=1 Tax=Nonomuraea lactucae TaxID=2249762 RepID=UPI0013B3DF57|nr:methyltransferase [Nonomuraea lactucae]